VFFGNDRHSLNSLPALIAPFLYSGSWRDGGTDALVADTLKPFDARLMKKYPVSTRVNRADNDDPECGREVPIVSGIPTLF